MRCASYGAAPAGDPDPPIHDRLGATLDGVTLFAFLARVGLALVFLVSAVAKLRDRSGARTAVEQFGVPRRLVGPVAAGLPMAELACAGLLLGADPAATVGAVGAALLLTAFTLAIVRSLRAGRSFDCHCFGQVGRAAIGWSTVGRNAVLLALAGVTLVGAGSLAAVPAELADLETEQPLLTAAVIVLGAALVGLGLALRTLMGRYGAVLLRIEALEVATGTAPPRDAPPFSLPGLDGSVVDLDRVLDEDKPVLLVFVSPTCVLCSDLLPELELWQQDPDHPIAVVVLSTGDVEANIEKLAGTVLRMGLQKDYEVADLYGVTGTPAAVLIGTDGLVAGPVARGVDAVLARHALLMQTVGAGAAPSPLHQIGVRAPTSGDALPDLVLVTEESQALSVVELTRRETVLVFWRSSCGFCARITEQVAGLEPRVTLLLVSDTDVATLRESGLSSPVVREPDGALSKALQVPGTPSAVSVRDAVLTSEVVVGGPAVLALLHAAAERADPSQIVTDGYQST